MKDAEEKTPNAVFECKNCDFVDEVYVPADQIKDEITEWATGTHTFTAKVNYQGIEYSTSKKWREGLYVAMCPIPAAEMIYGVDASITLGKDTFSEVFAVAEYADIIMTDEAFAKQYVAMENAAGRDGEGRLAQVRLLVKAMLDYGSKAQTHFDRLPGLLANRFFVTDDPSNPNYYAPEDVSADMIQTGSSDMAAGLEGYGLEYAGSTIAYLSQTSMRHYYKVTDQAKFDAVKDGVTFDGGAAPSQVVDREAGAATAQAEGNGGGSTVQAESVDARADVSSKVAASAQKSQTQGADADEYETQMLGAQKTTKSVGTGESTSVKATAPTVGSISSSGTATKLVSTGDNTSGIAVAALLLAAGAASVLGVASRKRC